MPVRENSWWPGAVAIMALSAPAVAQDRVADPVTDAVRTAAPLPGRPDVPSPPPEAQLVPAAPAAVDHRALEPQPVVEDPLDETLLPGRRRPGAARAILPDRVVQNNPGAVGAPALDTFPTADVPLPDRWRLIRALCPDKTFVAVQAICRSTRDPYHQNILKGDVPLDPHKVRWLPIHGEDWFAVLSAISDTVVEPRSFPTPVGVQTTSRPGSLDVFGRASSLLVAQTFTASASLIKGSTAFKPPEIEYRLTLAFNYNYARVNERRILFVEPSRAPSRHDGFIGLQEAFVDYHLRNVSDRYDFDSVRMGVQGFQADFRGFLFNDNQPGVRLFGNRDNNRFQYNIAVFGRLEKDTNSGLNDIAQTPRRDIVVIANVYRQDLPVPGFTSQILLAYNGNRERRGVEIDDNGFPVRPALLGDLRGREYDVGYIGYNGDGHFGRVNLTVSGYLALGQDRNSFFTGRPAQIRAFFAAAEPSYDIDWLRLRASALFASGDSDPYDNTESGFDAIVENPIFAGADTSYWIRQSIPFAGGGRAVGINGRNGILASLRSSKDQGQSNFNNPGTMLLGVGADADLTPEVRVSGNLNHLWFQTTETLQALRSEGSIPTAIGWDLSAAATWRPRMTQNIVFRLSGALLQAGRGFTDLFTQSGGSGRFHSVLANAIVTF
ncbi:flagellar biosynthesis protein FlhF [Sphingomonas aliaeris]|uniref:hypothetical protein n=1 Tax=Sphingomonas aliaeris TaxID=2759526 RepID=UPI001CECFEA5|nr:hypothetical protein [Sphingomonas aliaeris]